VGAVAAAVLVAIPIVYLAVRAGERGPSVVWSTVWTARTAALLARSVALAGVVAVGCTVVGVAGAWLVTFTDLPGRRVWRVALALPLALPSYVAAWSWIGWQPGLAGFWGAALVLVTVSYPYVYLPVLGALGRVDAALPEVGRACGWGPWRATLGLVLRQVRIATVSGAVLVVLYVLGEFGAVSIMRTETLTQAIYESYRSSFDRTPAAILGGLLIVVAAAPLALAVRHGEGEHAARVGGGARRRPTVLRLGTVRLPLLAGPAVLLGAALGVPAVTLVRWSSQGSSRARWSEVADAAVSTLWLSVLAAVATVAVALPVGYLSARHPGRLSRRVTTVAYAGHALPGIAVSLSLVFFGIRYLNPLYQRTPLLVGAYVVLFLSLAIGAVHNAVAQAPPALDDVARSLGCSSWGAWRRVTLPLCTPGLAAAATVVCIATMKELPATLLLRPIGTDTLATRLWSRTDAAGYAAAAPFAAALVLVAAVPTAVLTGLGLRERR
jgi:iron(III) transport system permease protein